jgi:hypothetical protein
MGIVAKFIAGLVMTLMFVVVVPYVTETWITPFIVNAVGDSTFLTISSKTLIQLLLYFVMILFIILLGGGAVFRWCGVVGVLGMIVAYYLLGNVYDAVFPIISIIVVYILLTPFRKKRENKKKDSKSKS